MENRTLLADHHHVGQPPRGRVKGSRSHAHEDLFCIPIVDGVGRRDANGNASTVGDSDK